METTNLSVNMKDDGTASSRALSPWNLGLVTPSHPSNGVILRKALCAPHATGPFPLLGSLSCHRGLVS